MHPEFLAEIDKLKSQLNLAIKLGITPKEVMQQNNEFLESLYSLAMQYYRVGNWINAATVLRSLIALDPFNAKFSLALGMLLQRTKNYPESITAYRLSSALDQTNPIPYFHLADCYMKLNEKEKALESLDKAIEFASDQMVYEPLVLQAKELKNSCAVK